MYNLSTDYERLYALLCEGEEVACYISTGWKNISGKEITSIALVRRDAEMMEINICHSIETVVCMDDAEKFTAECTHLNLQYIPQIDVKQVAGDGFDSGCVHAQEIAAYNSGYTDVLSALTKQQYLNTL